LNIYDYKINAHRTIFSALCILSVCYDNYDKLIISAIRRQLINWYS